ncbi:MAG: hypothetical protein LWW90_02025 [Candidatus Desulfofervidus auxilii]|nr:hypothetical protein [Candidatus Desulfofervidus auxilii]
MKKIKVKIIKSGALEGRLHCFGDFNPEDMICLKYCALNIHCAIVKQDYFAFRVMDESIASFMQLNKHE